MARRKKDKVKAARAREAERLGKKASGTGEDAIIDILDIPASKRKAGSADAADAKKSPKGEVGAPKKATRRKDSLGKKIPTESERRAKGDIQGSPKKAAAQPRPQRRTAKKILWSVAAHPFLILLGVILVVVFGVFVADVIGPVADGERGLPQEDIKTRSLIGMTSPARAVLDDTGKFDGFWADGETGIGYADLFDRDVTVDEQRLLDARGQAIGDDYAFAYNEGISSAKPAKDAVMSAPAADAISEIEQQGLPAQSPYAASNKSAFD